MFLELYLVAKRIECTNAIERGTADADAYFTIAFMCEYGVFGMSLDTQKALEYYTVAAAQGLAIAQCNLGKMYMKGEHCPKDLTKARELMESSAEQGHGLAQYYLATMLRDEDPVEARRLLKLAAAKDIQKAQYLLGTFFEHGHGGNINMVKARRFYKMAARKGHPEAEGRLAQLASHAAR